MTSRFPVLANHRLASVFDYAHAVHTPCRFEAVGCPLPTPKQAARRTDLPQTLKCNFYNNGIQNPVARVVFRYYCTETRLLSTVFTLQHLVAYLICNWSICFVGSMSTSAQLARSTATVTQTCSKAKHTPLLSRNSYISPAKPFETRRQGRGLQRHHGQCTSKASMGPSMPPAAFSWLYCLLWHHHCSGANHSPKAVSKV